MDPTKRYLPIYTCCAATHGSWVTECSRTGKAIGLLMGHQEATDFQLGVPGEITLYEGYTFEIRYPPGTMRESRNVGRAKRGRPAAGAARKQASLSRWL